MATAVAPLSVSVYIAGHRTKNFGLVFVNSSAFVKTQMLTIQRKMPTRANRNLAIRAQYDVWQNLGDLTGTQFEIISESKVAVCFHILTAKVVNDGLSHIERSGGSGADFVAGFLLGGAVFGTLAYIFAPQIRRSLLNEDEYGFRRAKRPIYYDEGLEKTRQTLNEKISQLNSAIDNVSSRLRGGNNLPQVPVEIDPEEAAFNEVT
ncbi:hypothetical protein Sango_0745900 [Sesamum angolense]|uniref:Uncharacterized protein n=1 Tax=Sesamum angolense TaxID=2727404 RepID=A0AAE2BZR3_9LAMI|nr:hypothetical protein Sango_0745900 [Sesamum angolense]